MQNVKCVDDCLVLLRVGRKTCFFFNIDIFYVIIIHYFFLKKYYRKTASSVLSEYMPGYAWIYMFRMNENVFLSIQNT